LLPGKIAKPSVAHLRRFINDVGFVGSVGSQYQHHPSASLLSQIEEFPPVRFECNGQEAQKRFCTQVGGMAYLARFVVERELREGLLAE
jgi:DNA-binding transcriptional LysR family regulator